MKPATPKPTPLSADFLRTCLADMKAGLFWQVLPRLEAYGQLPLPENNHAEQAAILYALGLAATGKPERAADILAAVASRHPNSQHPLQDLAELMIAQDRRPEALATGQALLRRTPDDTRIHATLGSLLVQTGQHDAAISLLKQAVALAPEATPARSLLAMALTEQGNMQAALECLHPLPSPPAERAAMLVNIGTILTGQGQMEKALRHFDEAIALRPDDARFHFNRSVALLKAGQYDTGWQAHEWRHALPGHTALPDNATLPPLKDAERLDGQRVLLVHEEGLGDTLMYLRYVPALAQRGAQVHLLVPPALSQLCQRVQGVHSVHVMRDDAPALPSFDSYCGFISLPRLFQHTQTPWGAPVPYLHANTAKTQTMAALLPSGKALRVGLVWGGAPRNHTLAAHIVDRRRSLPLSALEPLGRLPGVALISLQKGPYAEQMTDPPEDMRLYDPTEALHSMDDTAALIMGLDVVVSVDTSVAHLAGGLGKPVLLMDRYDNCWRWLHGRDDTPWYPNLRIIRQTTPRQWADVISRVAQSLTAMARTRR
ncbi:tetratricopeptide repeat protein [Acetobacter suratthaniensis]|uniref:Tetratricopeptide repeat protein n=1 Tax=Acetobacter suratthaniensis TaxID=1502841 RepID=A0ABS3LI76_9PROT|nr:tetratricopeptide repeat protein [Acetobacter suratthaniensis]MBO1327277.1 tetratricopeptide repeat protein [Acetobacter suratthaniensis]MCX2565111.1 tetratricopeptide repeat protein [Acetobacter suratthaniensis]